MTRLDDELPSRLVSQVTVNLPWRIKWCCYKCRRFGDVPVELTHDGEGHLVTTTSEEAFLKMLFVAHRGPDLIVCTERLGNLQTATRACRAGRTHVGEPETVWLNEDKPGMPPFVPPRWPPWKE